MGEMFKSTALALMLGLVSQSASGSAWNPDKGHGEIITGFVYADADQAIGVSGDRFDLQIYHKNISQTYANLGLTEKIALIGTMDWQDTQIVGPGIAVSFFEPSTISGGLQYQISRKEGHAVSVSLSYVDGIDLPIELLTIENREPAIELRGLWGESRTVLGSNVFAEVQLAGRTYLNGDYASAHSQITLGWEPRDRIMFLTKGRLTNIASGTFSGFPLDSQTRWETESSAVYRFRKNDYVEIGYTAIVGGRNTVLESGIKLGFWKKF